MAVDLFGPLEYKDMVKKRVTGKGWGVIFVCTASSAIHLELTESYSTDAFFQALRRFMCLHGTPHTPSGRLGSVCNSRLVSRQENKMEICPSWRAAHERTS
jgi:hypothetical protein